MNSREPGCACSRLDKKAKAEDWPVEYDSTHREYQLVSSVNKEKAARVVLRFCPWCGAKLLSSERVEFTDEQRRLVHKIRSQLDQRDSVAKMRKLFGPPIQEYDLANIEEFDSEYVYQYTFEHGGIRVVVKEKASGEVDVGFTPQLENHG